jgi:DNA-binding LytR/AlgR family response regulator
MKISVEERPDIEETEVIIRCPEQNEQVNELLRSISFFNKLVKAKKEGRNYTLKPSQIYYFDAVDNKVFAYTRDDVYEVDLKLYQLEEIFEETPLIRINKHAILNIRKIKSFSSAINGRMEATLINGERMIISRTYVPMLKQRLGGRSS